MTVVQDHLPLYEIRSIEAAINRRLNEIGINECFNFDVDMNYDDEKETAFTLTCEFTISKNTGEKE